MIALQWYWCQTMSFTTCGFSVKIILHLALPLLQTHFYCHAMRTDYKSVGVKKFNFRKREYTYLKCQKYWKFMSGTKPVLQKLQSLIHCCFSPMIYMRRETAMDHYYFHEHIMFMKIIVLRNLTDHVSKSYTSFYSEYYYLLSASSRCTSKINFLHFGHYVHQSSVLLSNHWQPTAIHIARYPAVYWNKL